MKGFGFDGYGYVEDGLHGLGAVEGEAVVQETDAIVAGGILRHRVAFNAICFPVAFGRVDAWWRW